MTTRHSSRTRGPDTGVFLQLTCEDSVAPAVPGHAYSFGVVKEAQARGDFDVLARRGRRALRIDVGDDPTTGLAALRQTIEQVLHYTTGTHVKKWS